MDRSNSARRGRHRATLVLAAAGLFLLALTLHLLVPSPADVVLLLGVLLLLAGALAGYLLDRHGCELAWRAAQHRILAENFPNGAVLLFDRRLRHTLAEGRGLHELGLSPEAVEGKTIREVFPRDVCTVLEPVYRAALDGRESVLEMPYADRDHLLRVLPVRDETGRVVSGLVVTQDVTERKRREQRLTELASRDALTGVWNRTRLAQELESLLGEVARGGTRASSLLLLDLNGFKEVNDTLGHDAGDELLRRVARAVEACVRRTDLVARLGGDEFAVLLPGATLEEAERVAAKVSAAIGAVWPLGTRGGVSIGIAAVGGGNWTAAGVLASADRAMYAVKRGEPLRAVS